MIRLGRRSSCLEVGLWRRGMVRTRRRQRQRQLSSKIARHNLSRHRAIISRNIDLTAISISIMPFVNLNDTINLNHIINFNHIINLNHAITLHSLQSSKYTASENASRHCRKTNVQDCQYGHSELTRDAHRKSYSFPATLPKLKLP